MADTKISALPAATDLADAVFPIVQGGANKKAATALITPAAIGAATASQGAKADTALQPGEPDSVHTMTGVDINPANGNIQVKTFSTNTTFTESLSSGHSITLHLIGGSSYVIGWPSGIKWTNGAAPILTAEDVVVIWKVGTTLYGAYIGRIV